MADHAHDIYERDPRSLADLISLAQRAGRDTDPRVLAAVLQDELQKPVQFDLGAAGRGEGAKAKTAASAEGLLLRGLGDLLRHPHPPPALLILTKDYARAHLQHPDSHLPRDVALVLYFACIAAAIVTSGRRITKLQAEPLRKGLGWAADRTWLTDEVRSLLRAALASLKTE
jgi:hypothetical protein